MFLLSNGLIRHRISVLVNDLITTLTKCLTFTSYLYLISFDGDHLTYEGALYIGRNMKEDKEFMNIWKNFIGLDKSHINYKKK